MTWGEMKQLMGDSTDDVQIIVDLSGMPGAAALDDEVIALDAGRFTFSGVMNQYAEIGARVPDPDEFEQGVDEGFEEVANRSK